MADHYIVIVLWMMFSVVVSCYSPPRSKITQNEIIGRFDVGDEINPLYNNHLPSKGSEQVFKAVWNVPRNDCKSKFGLDLNLESYGILANAEGTQWNGEAITIFYNEDLGLYPAFERISDGKVRKLNAGLPQLTNLTQHFEKATNDILAAIPNPEFSGLAVIDWEKWFPQWDFPTSIMDLYRGPSIELVRQRHPDWNNETLELVAKLEYEQSAKALMEGTLLLGQRLRPKGQWGFYHHPYCHNNVSSNKDTCKNSVKNCNDYISWLFRQTTAFYPSIYIPGKTVNVSGSVDARITEVWRMRESYGDATKQPIFSYCRFNYSQTNLYFNLNALNATILQSAKDGLAGIVIWGDHNDTGSVASCKQLQSYVKNALGPTVKLAKDLATSCSKRFCSGNGRCKGDILHCEQLNQVSSINLKSQSVKQASNPYMGSGLFHGEKGCTCLCFSGWSGNACNIPS